MRTLRIFFAASVLTLTLCLPTFAGDISTTIASPPPNTDGDIHTMRTGDITTGNADADAVSDSVTGAALSLIQSVLSLF
jgi:hypothetical protein